MIQMEALDFIIKSLLITVFSAPIFCVYKICTLVKLYFVSAPIIALMLTVDRYWPHYYTDLRLVLWGMTL